jgi:hypothetical protein
MTRKLLSVLGAAMITGVFGFSQAKANIMYDLDYTTTAASALPGTVSGFIETDGTLGALNGTNFVDWNITINVSSTSVDLLGPLSGNNSTVGCCSSVAPITATATTLTFPFESVTTGGLASFGSGTLQARLCYSDALTVGCGPIPSTPGGITWAVANNSLETGINATAGDIIATVATSATPLPAALPLFATGLGALGLFGWRRKRRAQAVAA